GVRARVRRACPRVLLNLMPEGLLATGLPKVTTLHDLLPLLYPSAYPRQQYYFRCYVPAVLRASRAVIVSSERTRRDLPRSYHIPPKKIHFGLPEYAPEQFAPVHPVPPPDGEPYLLYIGNV